jgi:hypothetical protein
MTTEDRPHANTQPSRDHARLNRFEVKFNYKLTNWVEFCKTLEAGLTALSKPGELTTIAQFHATLKQLDLVIKATIMKYVPMSKPSPYSKCWWSKELAALKKMKEKLAR